jgi:hypothetical protein
MGWEGWVEQGDAGLQLLRLRASASLALSREPTHECVSDQAYEVRMIERLYPTGACALPRYFSNHS